MPFFYACKSVPLDLNQYSPVVLVSVYSNSAVPWYDEKSGTESVEDGVLSGAVNKAINKKNPENETVQERINYAEQSLTQKIQEFGLEAITPQNFPEGIAYKNAGKSLGDYIERTTPAEGYDSFISANSKIIRTMCKDSGGKSALYVNFHFQKVMVKEGVHNKGVAARVVMSVFGTDSQGKKIVNKEYKAVSSDYADLINSSNWDKQKLVSLFPEITDLVITNFLLDYAAN